MTAAAHIEVHPQGERVALLALGRVGGLGYRALHRIASQGGSLQELVEAPLALAQERLRQAGVRSAMQSGEDLVRRRRELTMEAFDELHMLEERGVLLVLHGDRLFPSQLRELPSAPRWLFVEGDPDLPSSRSVAVVGKRKMTRDGRFLTESVVRVLRHQGLPIVSGLALGVDQRAHEEALEEHIPGIAVLPCGILEHYPQQTSVLRTTLLERGGAVVSEYLPHERPSKDKFPWRNRIQAGLARAVIPVEWDPDGGTAHTVRYASEYGRAVLGVAATYHEAGAFVDFLRQLGAPLFELPHDSHKLLEAIIRALSGRT